MAKYKVLQKFRDKETKEIYEANQEIEMTVKRADEAIRTLKKHDGEFLERIDNKDDNKDDSGDSGRQKEENQDDEPKNDEEGE